MRRVPKHTREPARRRAPASQHAANENSQAERLYPTESPPVAHRPAPDAIEQNAAPRARRAVSRPRRPRTVRNLLASSQRLVGRSLGPPFFSVFRADEGFGLFYLVAARRPAPYGPHRPSWKLSPSAERLCVSPTEDLPRDLPRAIASLSTASRGQTPPTT